jgi:hypothetical protein
MRLAARELMPVVRMANTTRSPFEGRYSRARSTGNRRPEAGRPTLGIYGARYENKVNRSIIR